MIIVGIVLVVLGLLFGIGWLLTVGLVLAVIGAVLWAIGTSRPVGGRRHWY